MTSFSTSAQCSASDSACRISPEQTNQVMHYLGQYIMVKQLYDQQEQHMVYCGGDLLGELLGRQSFSVKDPSPLYDMLRKNLVTLATATADAAQTLAIAQEHSMDIPSQDRPKQSVEESPSSRKRTEEGNIPSLPTSQYKCRSSRAGNLANEMFLLSQVVDMGKNDDLEDPESISDDTDTEVTSEDEWQCTECKKFNSPSKRYCFRCWALRKDWYSDCSKLTHSLSTSAITAIPEKQESEGIDVPDCRRTVSAPVVRPKDIYIKEENSEHFDPCNSVEFLDLAHSSESQETISSMVEQSDNLFEQRKDTENMEDCQNLLKPCSLCEKRPRDGNIIHGRTGHLVTCFHCARRLKKAGASCPICKKEIQLVIKVFVA
ncbi:MDM4 [Cervus elaphus hippelaphus]|uniref:Protein Mdm4 n=1 Tax=Cervus elaphus hippelaphus TaxID=46360 RepID=A0A212CRF7_CEREH|nr:MDM4 [Cervus elaphus hippelaphus]